MMLHEPKIVRQCWGREVGGGGSQKRASIDANFKNRCSTPSTKGTVPLSVDNECNGMHSYRTTKMHCTCREAAEGEAALLPQGASTRFG